MDLSALGKKLLAAARSGKPSEAVPYAFEKRIMARLGEMGAPAAWHFDWSHALGRAAVACLAIALLAGTWTLVDHAVGHMATTADLSDQFEHTVLAAAETDTFSPDNYW